MKNSPAYPHNDMLRGITKHQLYVAHALSGILAGIYSGPTSEVALKKGQRISDFAAIDAIACADAVIKKLEAQRDKEVKGENRS